jgi:hypothetical protein
MSIVFFVRAGDEVKKNHNEVSCQRSLGASHWTARRGLVVGILTIYNTKLMLVKPRDSFSNI